MATNPPIAIGEYANVPAPGSGVKSDYHQMVTRRTVHRFATVAARDANYPAATAGQGAICITFDTMTVWIVNAAPAWVALPVPTAWTAPAFTNGWSDYAGGNQTARYRKIGDQVYLEGMIKGATINTSAFTLPAGFRPLLKQQFPQLASAAFSVLVVDVAGTVTPATGSVANFSINCNFSTI